MLGNRPAPPVIDGLYVLEYAYADSSVRFEQRKTLNVDGKWLGRVPCLALCQPFDDSGFMVQHCSKKWESRGVAAGYKTVRDAKLRVARSYHGISSKWRKQRVAKRKARTEYRSELAARACSFCGRTPLEVQSMAEMKVRICNICVDRFYRAMHPVKARDLTVRSSGP